MFNPELSFDEKIKLEKLISQSVNNSAYTHDVYDYIEELLMKSFKMGCKEGEEKVICKEEHCDRNDCRFLEFEYKRGFEDGEESAIYDEEQCDTDNCDFMANEYESGYDAGVEAEKDKHNA